MNDFPIIPACKRSYGKRRSIYGVGINDADYMTGIHSDHPENKTGKELFCPFYNTWRGMLRRCYSEKEHKRSPSYKQCSVAPEWHLFSNFKSWMEKQDWNGKHLDKDLIVPGNKVYGPEFCIFVHQNINALICDSAASRGNLPLGVRLNGGSFTAQVGDGLGGQIHIGSFKKLNDACYAYLAAKAEIVMNLAQTYKDDSVLYQALNNVHARLLEEQRKTI